MSGSAGWWAKALGNSDAPASRPAYTPTPQYRPQPQQRGIPSLPAHLMPNAQPQAQPSSEPLSWDNLTEHEGFANAGEGSRVNKTSCPGCGGALYMANPGTGSLVKRCMECGYTDGRGQQGLPR